MQPKIKPDAPDSPLDQDASCLKISDDGQREAVSNFAVVSAMTSRIPLAEITLISAAALTGFGCVNVTRASSFQR